MRSLGKLCSRLPLGALTCLWLATSVLACENDDTATASSAADSGAGSGEDGTVPDAFSSSPTEDGTAPADGSAAATFSLEPIDFGTVGCGAPAATQTLTIAGTGSVPLAVTATTTGAGFSVSPTSLSIGDGGTETLTVTATVPASAAAGTAMTGSLNLFTNDPANTNVAIPLSATPSGATLAFAPGSPTSVSFPTSEVGVAAPTVTFDLVNVGNAGAVFTLGAPTSAAFSIDAGTTPPATLAPGATWAVNASFTPTNTATATASSAVSATGPVCGSSLEAISFTGQGTLGQITGWPTVPIDFGPAPCGGSAPAAQTFALTNIGTVPAHITDVSLTGAAGFFTSAAVGGKIEPGGGLLPITVNAPAVPSPSPLTQLTATLSITTDADPSPQIVTLTEEPQGAVLSFDTSPTPGFGNFGSVVLLDSEAQSFNVTNAGNSAADVTLSTSSGGNGAATPFTVSNATFSVGASGSQEDSVTFAPLAATAVNGTISVSTTSPLCAPLPAPVPLSGVGLGGGPVVSPGTLQFPATCGGAAPASQTFTVSNQGSSNLTWSLGSVTGPGAAQYVVSPASPPGLLSPGQSTVVTVSAAAVPSPAPNPNPAALAASITITTDVPLDPPHVVSLGEIPLGDQLSFSLSLLRFGQPPIGTTLSQSFVLENGANPGSPAASVGFALQGGGASAYTVTPASASSIAPGGGASGEESVAFTPPSAISYPAEVALTTSDPLCAPLPTPIQLSGTGAQGKVYVSASTLTFGTNPADPAGLVNCRATGPARSLTISNVGNAAFQITALGLGLGASSPYQLSGAGATLPATVPIGGSVGLIVTPNAIPASVPDPDDPSPFSDTLTITTNAALDSPHAVTLVMQAQGAVIASTPLSATWSFGTVSSGSIGTITSTIKNVGNAPASVQLTGLAQPTIFGVQNNPTTAVPNAVTAIVGQFIPPSSNGSWSDQGTLVVSAAALCAPLPSQWNAPTITLSGSSNGGGAVSVAGSLAFPTTNCGSAAPAGQTVTISNATNVPYSYSLHFNSGAFYALSGASSGTLPANGAASIIVTPQTVTPGPGVQPGSDPYADELVIDVATSPSSSFVVPISWALSGAVLSLPEGAGPSTNGLGSAFYPADSLGESLPMANTGTASASVDFAMQPVGVVQFSPASPFQIIPGIRSTPALSSTAAAATCPTTTAATLTFIYSGPVCQPFQLPSVTVEACVGAL
jgi:hypothetical protein